MGWDQFALDHFQFRWGGGWRKLLWVLMLQALIPQIRERSA